jgi:2-keto-4-pentenoate hydratase/2-oxohepta-3-ene-1,7-dioic acid hydratase in catechol pathway
MRICRYSIAGGIPTFGIVQKDMVHTMIGDLYQEPRAGELVTSLERVRLLAPVRPSKIIAVGLNYVAHAAEGNSMVPSEPLLFLKPPSSIIGPGATIRLPVQSKRVDHEAELAVIIGRGGWRIPRQDALDHILGYCCANDVSARDFQRADGQWTRAKGFDTFCPLGPWIETDLEPHGVEVMARVNGEIRQRGNTRDLVFPVGVLINYISSVMTLEPGDVILTGTPAGVSPIDDGDLVEVKIEGIGSLRNPVERGN